MNYFVDIKTLFTSREDRTLDRLAAVYCDRSVLRDVIAHVTGERLAREAVEGKKVLIKPNWVMHQEKASDEICLCTHAQFLLAALEMVLERKPARVLIGDAPIQSCCWDRLITAEFVESTEQLSKRFGIPVLIKDLRRVTFVPSLNTPLHELNPLSDYVIFDLGKESFLEPISRGDRNPFRVTNYNPDRLSESHGAGVHKYCISKELFDADVVISLPKVKTHQKAGITAALKNLVGVNGGKDYLPHHRIGGTGFGGDCYPGRNYLRYWAEQSLDNANRHQGKFAYRAWAKWAGLLWRLSFPGEKHHLAAGWYGNDTTWRMVLDINKVALYGKLDGTLAREPQRVLFSLCDGIVGGQGDGPLSPEPLALGIVCFSNHSGITDVSMGKLMGLDTRKVPMLRAAFDMARREVVEIRLNGQPVPLDSLDLYATETLLPVGWKEYLNEAR